MTTAESTLIQPADADLPTGIRVASLRAVALRLALVGLFTAILALRRPEAWWQACVVLAVISIVPAWRKVVMGIAALGVIYYFTPVFRIGTQYADYHYTESTLLFLWERVHGRDGNRWLTYWPWVVALVFAMFAAFAWFVRRFPKSFPARRPVLLMVLALIALLLAARLPLNGAEAMLVVAAALILGKYIWFFAYAIVDVKLRPTVPLARQLGYLRPFWGFSNVPLGKGANYLERVEAKDDKQFLAAQISGIKLLIWGVALAFFTDWINALLYTPHESMFAPYLSWLPPEGLPTSLIAMGRHIERRSFPLHLCWIALWAEFFFTVLYMAIWGHIVIAICRMAGFNAAPNTDRPLLATSIADFYNRIYYYFKELLATFFFYPAYLRYFKTRPKLRLFTATLLAAGFGNFLFHFLRDDVVILEKGMWRAMLDYHVYAVYCLILGSAIALSQMRLMAKETREPTGWRRPSAIAGVWIFYAFMNQLMPNSGHNILQHGSYLLSLFGL